jgi:hypothetical protein
MRAAGCFGQKSFRPASIPPTVSVATVSHPAEVALHDLARITKRARNTSGNEGNRTDPMPVVAVKRDGVVAREVRHFLDGRPAIQEQANFRVPHQVGKTLSPEAPPDTVARRTACLKVRGGLEGSRGVPTSVHRPMVNRSLAWRLS